MEWLIDALRGPVVELVQLGVIAGLAALTAQLRASQVRAREREHRRERELLAAEVQRPLGPSES
jgi:hypothetical protein